MGTNYLRPDQIESYQSERRTHQAIVERPDPKGELNKGESVKAIHRIDKCLEQAPPDLNPKQRDRANALVKKLEEEIRDGMLSHEEMRRCPPGAQDQHRRWQRQNKQRIIDWKNAQLALHKGIAADEAGDLCNIDRLRPRVSKLNMDGAIIPSTRTYSMPSEEYKSNWEAIFAREDPEKESMRQELDRLRASGRK